MRFMPTNAFRTAIVGLRTDTLSHETQFSMSLYYTFIHYIIQVVCLDRLIVKMHQTPILTNEITLKKIQTQSPSPKASQFFFY